MNSTRRAMKTRTMSVPGRAMGSTETSLRTKIEHQALYRHHAAAQPASNRHGVHVAGAPGGAAQLGVAVAAWRHRVRPHRNFPNQGVNILALPADAKPPHQGRAEQPE